MMHANGRRKYRSSRVESRNVHHFLHGERKRSSGVPKSVLEVPKGRQAKLRGNGPVSGAALPEQQLPLR
jgi:hypothetical protein